MHAIPEPLAVDARAKLMWGESPAKVRAFLLTKNVGEKDADALIEEILVERSASIRADGITKLWTGALGVAAPVAYSVISHVFFAFWNLKVFAALLVLGVVGIAKVTQGASMILRPRAVTGDLSNAAE